MKTKAANIEFMLGLTMVSVENRDDDELLFVADNGRQFRFYHEQDCCERVTIESIVGDLTDLIGAPLLVVEEIDNDDMSPPRNATWTFYKFATRKGYVDVRWCGESNGYYSERVDFVEITQ